jgi:hypothetical protein
VKPNDLACVIDVAGNASAYQGRNVVHHAITVAKGVAATGKQIGPADHLAQVVDRVGITCSSSQCAQIM